MINITALFFILCILLQQQKVKLLPFTHYTRNFIRLKLTLTYLKHYMLN